MKKLLSMLLILTLALCMMPTLVLSEEAAEPVPLTVLWRYYDTAPTAEGTPYMQKILSEQSYVDLTFINVSGSEIGEKTSLMFATGDYPEVIAGTWAFDATSILRWAGNGQIQPIDDYMNEEWMPNYMSMLKLRENYRSLLTTPDGHIYAPVQPAEAVPELALTTSRLAINQKWLDAVEMDIPTTTDELYEVLKAFRAAGDLNGNGVDDEWPMTCLFDESQYGQLSIMGFWGLADSNSGFTFRDGETDLIYTKIQPEYKECMKWLAKCYQDNLINPTMFTGTAASYNSLWASDEISWGFGSCIDTNDYPASFQDQFVLMQPVRASEDINPKMQERYVHPYGWFGFVLTDNATKEQADAWIRFADIWYDVEVSMEGYFGKKGLQWDYTGETHTDGRRIATWLIQEDTGSIPTWQERFQEVQYNCGLFSVLTDYAIWQHEIDQPEETEIYRGNLPENYYVDSWMTEEENERISFISTELNSYIDSTCARWITECTQEQIDAEWDGYVATLYDLGLEEFIEIRTGAYYRTFGHPTVK